MNLRRGMRRMLIVGFGLWCIYGLATIPGRGVSEIYQAGFNYDVERETECRKAGNPQAFCEQQKEESRKRTYELADVTRSSNWANYWLFVAGYPVLVLVGWLCYRIIRWVVTGFKNVKIGT